LDFGLIPDSLGQVGNIRQYLKDAIEEATEFEDRAATKTPKMQRTSNIICATLSYA